MKFNIYAVKDELTQKFLQPTFGENEDAVIRIFKTQINTLPIWKDNPADFSLYQVGEFTEETGEIIPCYHKIISGHSVKTQEGEKNGLHSIK